MTFSYPLKDYPKYAEQMGITTMPVRKRQPWIAKGTLPPAKPACCWKCLHFNGVPVKMDCPSAHGTTSGCSLDGDTRRDHFNDICQHFVLDYGYWDLHTTVESLADCGRGVPDLAEMNRLQAITLKRANDEMEALERRLNRKVYQTSLEAFS